MKPLRKLPPFTIAIGPDPTPPGERLLLRLEEHLSMRVIEARGNSARGRRDVLLAANTRGVFDKLRAAIYAGDQDRIILWALKAGAAFQKMAGGILDFDDIETGRRARKRLEKARDFKTAHAGVRL